MNKTIILSFFSLALVLVSGAADPLPLSKNYWKSEAFLKSFNGSYRVNAKVEPHLETKERELLVSIQSLMAKGERKDALKKLQASDLAKTSASVMFNIGNVAFELGELDLAEKSYVLALEKFPSYLRAHQNLAMIYLRDDEKGIENAYKHLLEAVKLGGSNASLLGMLGNCHLQKENYGAAMLAFKNAQLTEPDVLEWQVGEAECYRATGDFEDALRIFKSITLSQGYDSSYEFVMADLYERLERYDEAITVYELLRRKGSLSGEYKAHLGKLQLSEGSRSLGAELLREVLKKGELKDVGTIFELLEHTILSDELVLADELYSLLDTQVLKKEEYRYRFIGAWIGLNFDKKVESAKVLAELIKIDPLDAHALFLLAQYEEELEAKGKALLFYAQAAKGEGRYKLYALRAKGKLLVSMKRYEEALKVLNLSKLHDGSDETLKYIKAVEALYEASK